MNLKKSNFKNPLYRMISLPTLLSAMVLRRRPNWARCLPLSAKSRMSRDTRYVFHNLIQFMFEVMFQKKTNSKHFRVILQFSSARSPQVPLSLGTQMARKSTALTSGESFVLKFLVSDIIIFDPKSTWSVTLAKFSCRLIKLQIGQVCNGTYVHSRGQD